MKIVSSYFDSEWSFAQYHLKGEGQKESKIGFYPESNSLAIVTRDGNFYQVIFDPASGGECTLRHHEKLDLSAEDGKK